MVNGDKKRMLTSCAEKIMIVNDMVNKFINDTQGSKSAEIARTI